MVRRLLATLDAARGAPDYAALRERLEADIIAASRVDPPVLVDVMARLGLTLVRSTAIDVRAHPDEAGLRAEIADLLPDLDANYDARYRQGYERARTLVRDATARAALAQPAVPGPRQRIEAAVAHWRPVVKVQPKAKGHLAAMLAAIDAALAHPDEAGLRARIEALPEMVGEPNDGGWSLVRRSDVLAALAHPAVPVAGAEEGWVEHDGFATRVRPLHAAQPEDDGLARCPDCEHRQTEHATPGAECVHAFCSCDQALTLVLAALSESSEGVERRDGA